MGALSWRILQNDQLEQFAVSLNKIHMRYSQVMRFWIG